MKEKRGRGGISTPKKLVWGCRRKTGVELEEGGGVERGPRPRPKPRWWRRKECEGGGTLMKVIVGGWGVMVGGFTRVLPKTI